MRGFNGWKMQPRPPERPASSDPPIVPNPPASDAMCTLTSEASGCVQLARPDNPDFGTDAQFRQAPPPTVGGDSTAGNSPVVSADNLHDETSALRDRGAVVASGGKKGAENVGAPAVDTRENDALLGDSVPEVAQLEKGRSMGATAYFSCIVPSMPLLQCCLVESRRDRRLSFLYKCAA